MSYYVQMFLSVPSYRFCLGIDPCLTLNYVWKIKWARIGFTYMSNKAKTTVAAPSSCFPKRCFVVFHCKGWSYVGVFEGSTNREIQVIDNQWYLLLLLLLSPEVLTAVVSGDFLNPSFLQCNWMRCWLLLWPLTSAMSQQCSGKYDKHPAIICWDKLSLSLISGGTDPP